jgi:putative tricarboxylic transport membrane protein
VNRDALFGGAMLVVAAGYYAWAAAIPDTTLADAVGPTGLPKVYAVVLGALAALLVLTSRRSRNRESRIANRESRIPRVVGLLLIGVLYVALVPWLGYIVSIAGLIAATTYYQGGRLNRQVALVAVGGAIFFWLLFVIVLGIQQPSGAW